MNPKVLKTLEYDKILEILSNYTTGEYSRERIKNLAPATDFDDAYIMLEETDEALKTKLKHSQPPSIGVSDHISILKRSIAGGILSIVQLIRIYQLLKSTESFKSYSENFEENGYLNKYAENLICYKKLMDDIDAVVLNEDQLKDSASTALFDIRRNIRIYNDKIRTNLNSFINKKYTRFLQEPIVTTRGGRYVLPVKAEHKGDVQGIVHDTSSTGATLFIEPIEVVEANNKLKKLELDDKAETERILSELTGRVSEVAESLIENIKILTQLDIIFAKAKFGIEINGIKPEFVNNGTVNLIKARHPLIDKNKVVPINICLGDDFDTLVITGPNTGGKTVSLKTIGLFVLMAQSGILLPCKETSKISFYEEIYADIGDEQSIEQSLSTFSGHMKNIVEITDKVNDRCLVLFDELGAGTDPIEGAALAIAILEYVKNCGAKTVATTHYSELKLYAMSGDRIENASCEFNVETLQPTYRLQIGIPGKSNAFAISKKLGLKDFIISNAERNISNENIKFEDVISELEEKRILAEKEHISAKSIKQQASAYKTTLEAERTKLEKNKQKIIDDAVDEAKKIISNAEKEVNKMLSEVIELRKKNKNNEAADKLEELKKELKSRNKKLNKKKIYVETSYPGEPPKSVIPGTSVYVVKTDTNGTVVSQDKKGNVVVQTGILKITVSLNDIRVIEKDDRKEAVDKYIRNTSSLSKTLTLAPELDLRGLYADEAIEKTKKFIDDAAMSSLKTVTIVHGKGTGALRAAIHDYLKTHPYVESFRLGNYGEGDHGVTVVELS